MVREKVCGHCRGQFAFSRKRRKRGRGRGGWEEQLQARRPSQTDAELGELTPWQDREAKKAALSVTGGQRMDERRIESADAEARSLPSCHPRRRRSSPCDRGRSTLLPPHAVPRRTARATASQQPPPRSPAHHIARTKRGSVDRARACGVHGRTRRDAGSHGARSLPQTARHPILTAEALVSLLLAFSPVPVCTAHGSRPGPERTQRCLHVPRCQPKS